MWLHACSSTVLRLTCTGQAGPVKFILDEVTCIGQVALVKFIPDEGVVTQLRETEHVCDFVVVNDP